MAHSQNVASPLFEKIQEAYSIYTTSHSARLVIQHDNPTTRAFWSFFEPLLSLYVPETEKEINKIRAKYGFDILDNDSILSSFNAAISKIATAAERAFVLELQVAKQSNQLLGHTPEDRFNYFFEQLKQPVNAFEFWQTYPQLAHYACTVFDNWKTYFIEIISNLYADCSQLKSTIPPLSIIEKLTNIQPILNSPQSGGRCVTILTFNDEIKVVYKPRDCALDLAFGEFLDWFNQANIVPSLTHLAILSKSDHAWCEFIHPSESLKSEEVPIMYTKLGALLCMMYIFDTIDMHSDNILVVGDNPVLIDLETWMQPYLFDELPYRSVENTHLLPDDEETEPDQDDLIGYGSRDDANIKWTHNKKLVRQNEGRDDMQIVRKRLPIPKVNNSLMVDGEILNPTLYVSNIIKGFRLTYRHIETHKNDFLASLSCFRYKKLRVILRGNKKYDALMEDMMHPLHLQNRQQLEHFLDRLWIDADDEAYLKTLIPLEKADLLNLDNPYFYTFSDSATLYHNGKPIIRDLFFKTAFEVIMHNLEDMSSKDLEKQVRIIKKSFLALKTYKKPKEKSELV